MTTDQTNNDQAADAAERRTAAMVDAVMRSSAELLPRFAPQGFTPEAIAEGLIKAAGVVLMRGTGCTVFDVADVLDGFAAGFRTLPQAARENFTVVK